MTPIVKLVFGIDYDKARLTEFAARSVLCPAPADRARRFPGLHREAAGRPQGAGRGRAPGAPARAEAGHARRSGPRQAARARRRSRSPTLPADEEFAVVVTRRGADGRHEPVAVVDDRSAGRARHPPRSLERRRRGVVPVARRGSIGRAAAPHSRSIILSMTAHTRLAQPLVESIRKALTGQRASRRNPGLDPRGRARSRRIPRRSRGAAKPRRSRARDRIDRRRGRQSPDADRHRQRRHAVPGRFGRQRDRRAPADHPPPASPGGLRRPRRQGRAAARSSRCAPTRAGANR